MSGALHGCRSPGSLRRRLLLRVSLAMLLIWGLAAGLSYRQARLEVQEMMDGQMAKTARLLLAQVDDDDPRYLDDVSRRMAELRGAEDQDSELELEFRVARRDGTVFVKSGDKAPGTPLTRALGYADVEYEGQPWRSLLLETPDGAYRIEVAHSFAARDDEAFEIARNTVLPLGLLLPLMIAAIYFSVRRGLKPLDDLTAEVSARSPENLSELLPTATPKEIRPLVYALNRLLGRLAATLDNERRFTADAAHELRTPLSALKIHAQVALASKEPAPRKHALNQLIAGTDRATRLVEQLLRLARLDPLVRLADPRPIDLAELIDSALGDARATAEGKSQTLRASVENAPVVVNGDRELLAAALRNLIDNALRYTPPGGTISVEAHQEYGAARLVVSDNGNGVAAEELPRLVERFYRGSEATAEGSGLGLAIVQRIAELHGARLEVENVDSGGFRTIVRWCQSDAIVSP